MTDQELYDSVFDCINAAKENHYKDVRVGVANPRRYAAVFEAYVTLNKDIQHFKAGTKMRVFLASSMGDLCLTTNLKAANSYELRVMPGEGALRDCEVASRDP